MPTHTLKLLRREEAAESTMSFYFDKPAGFQFKPSQYLDCSLRDPAETETEAEAGSDLTWRVDVVVASTIEAISPVVDQLMQSLKTSCSPPEPEGRHGNPHAQVPARNPFGGSITNHPNRSGTRLPDIQK